MKATISRLVRQAGERMQPEDFFAGHPDARAVFEKVRAVLNRLGPLEVRTSESQVALRRQRGFAFLWLPGQYLSKPTAEVVLSIVLGRHDPSARFKEVAHPVRCLLLFISEPPGRDRRLLAIEVTGPIVNAALTWTYEQVRLPGQQPTPSNTTPSPYQQASLARHTPDRSGLLTAGAGRSSRIQTGPVGSSG